MGSTLHQGATPSGRIAGSDFFIDGGVTASYFYGYFDGDLASG